MTATTATTATATTATTVTKVEFFFDPGCPWTWQTSRWLRSLGIDVTWRAFRLELLSDAPLPPQWQPSAAMSAVTLRLVESLAAQSRHGDIARVTEALGIAVFEQGQAPSAELARATAASAGLDGSDLAAMDDPALDDAVRASFAEARTLSGPDLGSPVLGLTFGDGRRRGFFGPIVTGAFDADEAARLWDAVVTLAGLDRFSELKRGRTLYGDLHASLTPHV